MSPRQTNGSPRRRKIARQAVLDPTFQPERSAKGPSAGARQRRGFDPDTFLATIGEGRKILPFVKKQTIFTQGDNADAVFYLQEGKVRLTVVSKTGKVATIGILNEGSFF